MDDFYNRAGRLAYAVFNPLGEQLITDGAAPISQADLQSGQQRLMELLRRDGWAIPSGDAVQDVEQGQPGQDVAPDTQTLSGDRNAEEARSEDGSRAEGARPVRDEARSRSGSDSSLAGAGHEAPRDGEEHQQAAERVGEVGRPLAGPSPASGAAPLKLYVDDVRPCPEGWAIARTYHDAIQMMQRFEYDTVSLDHDLGEAFTGYDIMCAIEAGDVKQPRDVVTHSYNPVGKQNIIRAIASWKARRQGEQLDTLAASIEGQNSARDSQAFRG